MIGAPPSADPGAWRCARRVRVRPPPPPQTTQAEQLAAARSECAQVRALIESLCMQLPRHGDSIIVCECAQVRAELAVAQEQKALWLGSSRAQQQLQQQQQGGRAREESLRMQGEVLSLCVPSTHPLPLEQQLAPRPAQPAAEKW
eukprot:COSAG01_NODE_9386_length_2460_cov_5.186785_2_plen_145_part_00